MAHRKEAGGGKGKKPNSSIRYSAAAGQRSNEKPLASSLAPHSREQEPRRGAPRPPFTPCPPRSSPAGARLPRKERPSCRASSRQSTRAAAASLPPSYPPGQHSRRVGLIFPSHLHIPIYKGYPRPSLSSRGQAGEVEAIVNPFRAFTFCTLLPGCVFSAPRGRRLSTERTNSLPSGRRLPAPAPRLGSGGARSSRRLPKPLRRKVQGQGLEMCALPKVLSGKQPPAKRPLGETQRERRRHFPPP